MKNKKINSEKVKAILKKSFDVFCYVVTALAITLGIAVGVNKCSSSAATESVAADLTKLSQPSNSTVIRKRLVNVDDYNVYLPNFEDGNIDYDFDYLRSPMGISTALTPTSQSRVIYYYDYNQDMSYWLSNDNTFHRFRRIAFWWESFPVAEGTPQYEYKLSAVSLFDVESADQYNIYVKTSSTSVDDTGFIVRSRLVLSGDVIDDVGFLAFWKLSEKTQFTFNESFNYNAPFNLNVNAVFGSTSFDGGGDTLKYKDYDVGWFISNGQIFNRIRWWAINSQGVSVMIGGNVSTLTSDSDWVYTFMYYINTRTGNEVIVNSRDSIPYNGGNSRYYANSTTWQVPAFRKIVLLTELSDTLRDSLQSFNNNNQTTYGGGVVSTEVNDVFSLVASAFSGLLPILAVAILPNITIGTLLFVPLVAMLVFAIIRIIKK